MKAVGLQLALDLMHEKEHRDLITGLKSRTNAGREVFNSPSLVSICVSVLQFAATVEHSKKCIISSQFTI